MFAEMVGDELTDAEDFRIALEEKSLNCSLEAGGRFRQWHMSRSVVGKIVRYARSENGKCPQIGIGQWLHEAPMNDFNAFTADQTHELPQCAKAKAMQIETFCPKPGSFIHGRISLPVTADEKWQERASLFLKGACE